MNAYRTTLRNLVMSGLILTGLATLTGCDLLGTSYYDPTAMIQSVVYDRLDTMYYYADAWDAYILE